MILKELEKPILILMLEALLRRLPKNHSKRQMIEEELSKRVAGFRGEQSLDYYLENFISETDYMIFRSLRVPIGTTAFQIDTLLISLYVAMIVEVKNYAGTLFFESDYGQVIQTNAGVSKIVPNPLLQVKRQLSQMQKWLNSKHLPPLPFEHIVLISNPTTKIQTNPDNTEVIKRVLHTEQFPEKVNLFESIYKQKRINQSTLKKVSHRLIDADTPIFNNILEFFGIDVSELLTGIHCTTCDRFGMLRQVGTWYCQHCFSKSENAHVQGLIDYFLLVKQTITNAECREFLQIFSRHLAKRILTSMDLSTVGSCKYRTYHLSVSSLKQILNTMF